MDSVDSLFPEAVKQWRLNDLYRALGQVKGGEKRPNLNPTEKALLRGLLCLVHPNDIAIALNWKPSSVKTELSTTIYQYVKNFTDHVNQRIRWHNVSEWLEIAGYKLTRSPTSENLFEDISKANQYIAATAIIRLVEQQVLASQLSRPASMISHTLFQEIQEVGDGYFAKGDYASAMDVYTTLVKQYAVEYPGILLKIAQIYNCAECYRDSVVLTYFALNYIRDDHAKGKLYHLLAIAFDELCRQNPNPGILRQALNFYREASDLSDQSNAVVLWNKFDLIMNFIHANQDHYSQHINMAKIAWIDFKSATTYEASNFKDYVQEILADMERVLSEGIADPWLSVEVNRFASQRS
ncbi:MAG: hypothetical protein AAFO06_23065 [Cyanobacteria bacterium J06597_16]